MRTRIIALLIGVVGLGAAPAFAQDDDAKAGKRVYMTKTCLACHGRNGAKAIQSYPVLAGQNEAYLLDQMAMIKSGERSSSIDPATGHRFIQGMADVMHLLSEDDMMLVSKWLAAQTPAEPEVLDPAPTEDELAAGRTTFKKLGCVACHGKDGTKASNKAYPILAGLDRGYMIRQMTDMREKVQARAAGRN